jgi:hypothetical protein
MFATVDNELGKAHAKTTENPPNYNTVIHGTSGDCVVHIEGYRKAGCKEFMLILPKEDYGPR